MTPKNSHSEISEIDLMIASSRSCGNSECSTISIFNYFAMNYQFWRLPKYVKPKKKRTSLKSIKENLMP